MHDSTESPKQSCWNLHPSHLFRPLDRRIGCKFILSWPLSSFLSFFPKEPVRDRKKVKNSTKILFLSLFNVFFLVKHSGNLSMEQVKKVAKQIENKSLAKTFTGTIKQVLGTWYTKKEISFCFLWTMF